MHEHPNQKHGQGYESTKDGQIPELMLQTLGCWQKRTVLQFVFADSQYQDQDQVDKAFFYRIQFLGSG